MRAIRPFHAELDALYTRLLGRPIDHSGYFHYATLLERGEKTLADVEKIVRASPEYRQRQARAEASNRSKAEPGPHES